MGMGMDGRVEDRIAKYIIARRSVLLHGGYIQATCATSLTAGLPVAAQRPTRGAEQYA